MNLAKVFQRLDIGILIGIFKQIILINHASSWKKIFKNIFQNVFASDYHSTFSKMNFLHHYAATFNAL